VPECGRFARPGTSCRLTDAPGALSDAGADVDAGPADVAGAGLDVLVDTVKIDVGLAQADYDAPGCATNFACSDLPATPYCATALGQCVECLTSWNCAASTNNCENYHCVPASCVPGSKLCNGSFVDTCNLNGKGFVTTVCPDAFPTCIKGECSLCVPNKSFCGKAAIGQPRSKTVLQCNDLGNATQIVEQCKGDQVCHGGSCKACNPDSTACDGGKAMICESDGSGWTLSQDCALQDSACVDGVCTAPCPIDLTPTTNAGCEFWAVDLDNAYVPSGSGFYDAQNAQFSVIIANTKSTAAVVEVSAGTGQSAKYTVSGGALKILNLPDPSWKDAGGKSLAPLNQDGTNINKNVYRVHSDQPIVAYQFNPLQNVDVFSNDASLLLPVHGLGTEYWVMTREQSTNELKSYLTIVATQPGKTHVKLISSAETLPGPNIPAMAPGEAREFDVSQGEVINLETNLNGADMTGSWIKADKVIAVFGGSEASNSPNTDHCVAGKCQYQGWPCTSNEDCPKTCCADHMEEQLFPVSSWGSKYVATKLAPRGKEKDAWRVLASTDGTVVTLDPPQVNDAGLPIAIPAMGPGEWFEFESAQDFVISANHPIEVGQFMASANAPNPNNDLCTTAYGGKNVCTAAFKEQSASIICSKNSECPNITEPTDAKTGDPDFAVSVAANRFLADYMFLVPAKYSASYINVIAPTGATATLDGDPVDAANFKPIGAQWAVARLAIQPGMHSLKGSKPIGLIVYGYSEYVSYSYAGGAALN